MIKRALVTGAGGFIGKALAERLSADGAEVIAVGRDAAKLPKDCRCVKADVREPGALMPWLNAETVLFHLAGHTSVAGSVADPLGDFDCNTTAFMEVLLAVRETGTKLVFPSSPAVFAADQPLPLSELAAKRPTSPYGAAKLACEGYAQAFHACYGIDVRIARIFNVYGPGMRRFAIYDFWRKINQNPRKLEILGDGQQLRDYLYMDDAVEALLTIARHGAAGEDYNVASGRPVRTLDLAREVGRCMGHPKLEIAPSGKSFPGDIPKWYADTSKLHELGFVPKVGLKQGLTQTVDGLQRSHVTDERSPSKAMLCD